jgi:hypothetical protein
MRCDTNNPDRYYTSAVSPSGSTRTGAMQDPGYGVPRIYPSR